MSAPIWQAGKNYNRGAIVQPASVVAPASAALVNPDFESGTADWTLLPAHVLDTVAFTGTQSVSHVGTTPPTGDRLIKTTKYLINPGTSITASCYFSQGLGDKNKVIGAVCLVWYDAANVEISTSEGSFITSSSGSIAALGAKWKKSSLTAVAPQGAAKVAIGGIAKKTQSDGCAFDNFAWDLISQASVPGLLYRAVQQGSGVSSANEPAWPPTLGVQVNDGTVIWEGVLTNRVEYQASYILRTSVTEPVWPTEVGAFVSDGTVSWKCIGRNVQDEKCPNGKVVAAAVGKVFCGDGDITPYSATANPLDWSSQNDSGYISNGLNQNNVADVSVLHPYRGNMAVFTASTFQNWQVDEDPQLITLLDQMEGVGSQWQNAIQSVGNDNFFVSQLGVRSLGVAVGGNNLSTFDIGSPVDSLVQQMIDATIADGGDLISTYYPSEGEYWLTSTPGNAVTPSSLTITQRVVVATESGFSYPLDVVGAAGPVTFVVTGGSVGSFNVGLLDDGGNWSINPAGDPPWTPLGIFPLQLQATDGATTHTINLEFEIV